MDYVLPALIRKMHLAKCLENNDIESIRIDFDKRPIENIDGKSSDEDILHILEKYGISISFSIPTLKNKKVISDNLCNSRTGNKKNN